MLNKQDYKTSFFRINFKILERNKLGLLGKWENERKIRNIIAYLIFLISFGNSNNIIHTSLKNFISYLSFPVISQEQSSLKKKNRRKKKTKKLHGIIKFGIIKFLQLLLLLLHFTLILSQSLIHLLLHINKNKIKFT